MTRRLGLVSLGNIPGRRGITAGSPAANVVKASWVVKVANPSSEIEIEVTSEKGGTERRKLALK